MKIIVGGHFPGVFFIIGEKIGRRPNGEAELASFCNICQQGGKKMNWKQQGRG